MIKKKTKFDELYIPKVENKGTMTTDGKLINIPFRKYNTTGDLPLGTNKCLGNKELDKSSCTNHYNNKFEKYALGTQDSIRIQDEQMSEALKKKKDK